MLIRRDNGTPTPLTYLDLIEKMLRFPKPLVAAVNGAAVAGGAGLVMACDLVVASERSAFGFPEPKPRRGGGHGRPAVGISRRRRACQLSVADRQRSSTRRPLIAWGCFTSW